MSDKPGQTAEEKMADALPVNAKYVAAHPNNRRDLLVSRILVSAVCALTRLDAMPITRWPRAVG